MHEAISYHLSQISRLTTALELIAAAEVGDFDALALAAGGLAVSIDREADSIRDLLEALHTYEQEKRGATVGGAR